MSEEGFPGEAKMARAVSRTGNKGQDKSGKSHSKRKKGNCLHCQKKGHFWRECRSRPEDWKPPKKKESEPDSANPKSSSIERACMARWTSTGTTSTWCLDSGASAHMTSNFNWLEGYTPYQQPQPIVVGNGDTIYALGKGSQSELYPELEIGTIIYVS